MYFLFDVLTQKKNKNKKVSTHIISLVCEIIIE